MSQPQRDLTAPAPEGNISELYRKYKVENDNFIDWLAPKAKGTGLVNDLFPPANCGNPGRANHSGARPMYKIPTTDLTKLAKALRDSATRVPSSVFDILTNVISWREEVVAWYQKRRERDGDAAAKADKGHQHYIIVLQVVSEMLSPLVVKQEEPSAQQTIADLQFRNNFAPLEVEEPSEEYQKVQPAAKHMTSGDKPQTRVRYTIEQPEEDQGLAAYCFLMECVSVRREVQKAWHKYGNGLQSLTSTSLVIDYGIALIRDLNQELVRDFPKLGIGYWQETTLRSEANVFIRRRVSHKGTTTSHSDGGDELSDIDDFLQTTKLIWKIIERIAGADGQGLIASQQRDSTIMSDPTKRQIAGYGKAVYDLLEYGKYVHMMRSVREATAIAGMPSSMRSQGPEAVQAAKKMADLQINKNDLVQAFMSITKGDDISPSISLALVAFWDASLLGQVRAGLGRGLRDLRSASTWMKISIAAHEAFSRNCASEKAYWSQKEMWREFKEKVLDDAVYGDFIEHIARLGDLSYGEEQLQPDRMTVMRSCPWLSGMKLLEVSVRFHQLGAILTFQSQDKIRVMTHLYNAVRQSSSAFRDLAWADLEFLITAQSEKAVFFGGRPHDVKGCAKAMELSCGISAASAIPRKLPGGWRELKAMTQFMSTKSAKRHGRQFHWEAESIDALRVCEKLVAGSMRDSPGISTTARPHEKMRLLSEALQQEELVLNFDLVALQSRCAALLNDIQANCLRSRPALYPCELFGGPEDGRLVVYQLLKTIERIGAENVPEFCYACEKVNQVARAEGAAELSLAKARRTPRITDIDAFDKSFDTVPVRKDVLDMRKETLKQKQRELNKVAKRATQKEKKKSSA